MNPSTSDVQDAFPPNSALPNSSRTGRSLLIAILLSCGGRDRSPRQGDRPRRYQRLCDQLPWHPLCSPAVRIRFHHLLFIAGYKILTIAARRIGDLRFRLPKPIESYDGQIDATGPATQCLQPAVSIRQDMPEQMLRDMTEYFAKLVSSAGGDAPYGEDCMSPFVMQYSAYAALIGHTPRVQVSLSTCKFPKARNRGTNCPFLR